MFSPLGRGPPFQYFLIGKEGEGGLSIASDVGSPAKQRQRSGTRDCSDPAGSIWFLVHG